jgi:peptidylprolyl isomerase
LDFTEGKDYFWELQTSQGLLTIKLLTDSAPMHVSSTVYLTQLGFYDDLTFHRVIPGFMAQGGDPIGSGGGNPGYKYDGEFDGSTSHDDIGILSMANAGPGTDGSQFFITFKPTPFLDGKHTIFGKVVSDLENSLTKIEALGSRSGRTKEEIKIIKATIRIADRK